MKSLIAMAAQTVLAATAAVALCASPAAAQSTANPPAANPSGKHNSKAPVDITADQAEFHNNDCVYVYTGSVEALQDTSRIRSDVMIAHLEVTKGKQPGATAAQVTNGCGATTSVEAKGHVYYVAADGRRVHGDNGFYDLGASTITITGDVTAVDSGNNVMRGTKMVYNTQTGEGHVEGGAKGPGAKNRPRGVFYPKDAGKDASAAGDTASADKPPAEKKKKKAAQ
jgi:lipopolysaccharide export system protein LptA